MFPNDSVEEMQLFQLPHQDKTGQKAIQAIDLTVTNSREMEMEICAQQQNIYDKILLPKELGWLKSHQKSHQGVKKRPFP